MSGAVVRLPLIETYLREQRLPTLVERFAERHEQQALPSGSSHYRELIPLERPRAGQQYAFEVDLDACTGCKACVTACHRQNGLDAEAAETWRSVGLLHGGTPEAPVQQTVTTACHHCLDPGCMKGCPVNAYEKDPTTGIVRHLDDQCIGCQYCTLTCPYEVPQYNKARGIVRKCDMCSDRLAEGEAPACVNACPNEAIRIKVVDTRHVLENAEADHFLPGAPSPGITVPTTEYVSRRPLPKNLLPADYYKVRTGAPHFPLVIMLVLTQLSVGTFLTDYAVTKQGNPRWFEQTEPTAALLALALAGLALFASVFHLGRPLFAFRAVLGLRTSWMSREIVAFGAFVSLALAHAALLVARLQPEAAAWLAELPAELPRIVLYSVLATGTAGVACSAMIYAATHRRWWSAARANFRFFGTTLVLGLSTTLLTVQLANGDLDPTQLERTRTLCFVLCFTSLCKLSWETGVLIHLKNRQLTDLKRTALLLVGPLRPLGTVRLGLGAMGGLFLPLLVAGSIGEDRSSALGLSIVAWLALLVAEILERTLFFRAVSVPRMPGAIGG